MNRPARLAAAALAFVLAAGVRLAGQSYRSFSEEFESIQKRSRLRIGRVRIVPVLRLFDVGYDSNVYLTEEGGEPVGDFTATLSPEIRGYWLATSSLILSGMDNPEFLAYAQEDALRTFSNSFSVGLRWLALRRFSLSGEYHDLSHVRRSLSELDQKIRDTEVGETASLFFETPRGTAIGFVGATNDYRYEDIVSGAPDDLYAQSLDRREDSAALEVYYRVFSRSHFFSTVVWRRYDFAYAESSWRDATSVEVSGGLRFPLVGRARGTVSFGWKSFDPDSPDRTPFAGLIAATDVFFRAGRFAFNLGLHRDNEFSYIETAYYYVDSGGRAALSFYLFGSLRIDLGFDYGRLVYPEPGLYWDDGVPVVVDSREDVQWNVSAGPVVRVSGTIGLGLTYNLYTRTSNAPGYDIRQEFIGAFVTYEF